MTRNTLLAAAFILGGSTMAFAQSGTGTMAPAPGATSTQMQEQNSSSSNTPGSNVPNSRRNDMGGPTGSGTAGSGQGN